LQLLNNTNVTTTSEHRRSAFVGF